MINLDSIILVLKETTTQFRQIAGAISFANLGDSIVAAPGLWVVPAFDRGEQNQLSTCFQQRIQCSFGVVYVVDDHRTMGGEDVNDLLRPLRLAVFNSIVGYEFDDNEPIGFDRGQLMGFKYGQVWWQDTFHSAFNYRRV